MLRRRPRHRHPDPAPLNLTPADEELRKADPAIGALIDARGPIDPDEDRRGSRPDPYEALARAIVGQQLSVKAAGSIWARVIALFGDATPKPEQLVEIEPERLREAGLSWSKVSYLRDLAERVMDGELDLGRIAELDDEAVIEELTRIKGIGRWTGEMFLIFHLGRPDVVSTGDLGIRRAAQLAYKLDDLPAPEELEQLAEGWRPHRSLACLYLWRSLQNAPA
ncbi:MAG: DNA-3-methyladenine glycosylase [Chloroflexota bacterium]|nr:DNA-3-methyladenine glycosylase [Chloroflexota bacterium]